MEENWDAAQVGWNLPVTRNARERPRRTNRTTRSGGHSIRPPEQLLLLRASCNTNSTNSANEEFSSVATHSTRGEAGVVVTPSTSQPSRIWVHYSHSSISLFVHLYWGASLGTIDHFSSLFRILSMPWQRRGRPGDFITLRCQPSQTREIPQQKKIKSIN